MEETHVEFLEAQLAIGKSVIESMFELIPKNRYACLTSIKEWYIFYY